MKLSVRTLFISTILLLPFHMAQGAVVPGLPYCVLGLGQGAQENVVTISGDSKLIAFGCNIQSNSNLLARGNTVVSGQFSSSVIAVGSINVQGNASISLPQLPISVPAQDPYALLAAPSNINAVCGYTNYSVNNKSATLEPGVYCKGITLNNATVTMKPGVYVIRDGDFKIRGASSSVTGTGVTIYLGKSGDESVGNISWITQGNLELRAPTDVENVYLNVLVFQDRTANTLNDNSNISENEVTANIKLSGAIYTPARSLSVSSFSDSTNGCLQLIAKQVEVTGNAAINLVCAGGGSPPPGS